MKTTKTVLISTVLVVAFAPSTKIRADNLAAAAAKASALVKRPIAASPHALEEFPWLLRGYPPPVAVTNSASHPETYPDNLTAAAAKASALVKRPIAASPHALEEFPWLVRGYQQPVAVTNSASHPETYPDNLAAAAAKASALVKRPIAASPHALEEFPWLRWNSQQTEVHGRNNEIHLER